MAHPTADVARRMIMADVPHPSSALPAIGVPSEDARLAMALHALGDLRHQLQGAQRLIAGTIAELTHSLDLPDDLRPPADRP